MAVNLSPIWGAGAQLLDNSGNVLTGGKIYTYLAGTTTPATTYTSNNGGTANSNPIILNSAGRVPYEIWLTDSIEYKFVLKDSNDTLIGTWDNLVGINSNFINYYGQQEIQTATAGQTVFTLNDFEYTPGTGNLSVFVDGVNQYGPGAQYAYVETDSSTITFVSGLHVGASVKFTTTKLENPGVADASQISYTYPDSNAVTQNVEERLAQYVSVKDFGAVGDGVTDDTTAIQNAIDASYKIYFPNGEYKVTSTITLKEYSYLFGEGADATLINSSATGFTFELLNPNGTAEVNAPKFFDLTIHTTDSGIRLNSLTGGFDGTSSTQQYMMRPVIERCIIQGDESGYGVQWSKSFDGFIQNCRITNFQYNVYFKGCDICAIVNNRINQTYGSLIKIESSGTFGSQTLISHNDTGGFGTGATNAIESSDRDLIVENNYIEVGDRLGNPIDSVINIIGGYSVTINGNRIEAPANQATNWLLVGSYASPVNLYSLYVTNNVSSGDQWGNALFNGTFQGSTYWKNVTQRQLITHFGNQNENGFPFNSTQQQQNIYPRSKYPWIVSPSTVGLLSGDAGETIYCYADSFALPPSSTFGSLVNFHDNMYEVNGSVKVNILARSGGSGTGQQLKYQLRSGPSTVVANGTITVTNSFSWYVTSTATVSDLYVVLYNDDTTTGEIVYIEQIVVEYA